MPEYTSNYNLVKQLPNEYYDREIDNDNLDTIDTVLQSASKITDTVTNTKYNFGIENGQLYIVEVE